MNRETVSRFWAKVSKTEGCWLWTGSKRNKGYGAFVWADVAGNVIQGSAHRFSYELHNGAIPAGLCVLHRCDTPACVRPDHLFLGTKRENNADMVSKGRHVPGGTKCGTAGMWAKGESHHATKLTEADVLEIRRLRADDGLSFRKIGIRFNICTSAAYKIVKRTSWKHI